MIMPPDTVRKDHPLVLQLIDAANYADTLTQSEDEIIRQARRLSVPPHFPDQHAAAVEPAEQVYSALLEEHLGRSGYSWFAAELFSKKPGVKIDFLVSAKLMANRVLTTAKRYCGIDIQDWENRVLHQIAANHLQIGHYEKKFFGQCWVDYKNHQNWIKSHKARAPKTLKAEAEYNRANRGSNKSFWS